MNSGLVVSTEVLPPGAVPSLPATHLRAQLYRSSEKGFAAWLTLRPVIWQSVRAALLFVQAVAVSPTRVLGILGNRVDVLHSEVVASGMAVYAPWDQRDRMETLLMDLFNVASQGGPQNVGNPSMPVPLDELPSDFHGADIEVITVTGSFDPSPRPPSVSLPSTGDVPHDSDRAGLQSRPDDSDGRQVPRFTQTPEGIAARAALLILGNGQPGLLGRFTSRTWKLPFGITVNETVRLRTTRWEVQFVEIEAEQLFMSMCKGLPPPLCLDNSDDGTQEEGMTIIQSTVISAPAADEQCRKNVAGILWELVNEVWLSQQREILFGGSVGTH